MFDRNLLKDQLVRVNTESNPRLAKFIKYQGTVVLVFDFLANKQVSKPTGRKFETVDPKTL
jgi:hypothetical protein